MSDSLTRLRLGSMNEAPLSAAFGKSWAQWLEVWSGLASSTEGAEQVAAQAAAEASRLARRLWRDAYAAGGGGPGWSGKGHGLCLRRPARRDPAVHALAGAHTLAGATARVPPVQQSCGGRTGTAGDQQAARRIRSGHPRPGQRLPAMPDPGFPGTPARRPRPGPAREVAAWAVRLRLAARRRYPAGRAHARTTRDGAARPATGAAHAARRFTPEPVHRLGAGADSGYRPSVLARYRSAPGTHSLPGRQQPGASIMSGLEMVLLVLGVLMLLALLTALALWLRGRIDSAARSCYLAVQQMEGDLGIKDRYQTPWIMLLGNEQQTSELCRGWRLSSSGKTGWFGRWWYDSDAAMLAVPGAMFNHGEGALVQIAAWWRLLRMLVMMRAGRPLDAVIWTVPAEQLWASDQAAATGLAARRKFNEMLQRLGLNIPVYLLVTGLETLPGIKELADALPDDARDRVFGWSSPFAPGTAWHT